MPRSILLLITNCVSGIHSIGCNQAFTLWTVCLRSPLASKDFSPYRGRCAFCALPHRFTTALHGMHPTKSEWNTEIDSRLLQVGICKTSKAGTSMVTFSKNSVVPLNISGTGGAVLPALVAQCYRHWWRSVPALVAQCYHLPALVAQCVKGLLPR